MTTTAFINFESATPVLPAGVAARTAIANELSRNAGRWALLGSWPSPGSARQMAYCIRHGLSGWQMFGPGFEAQSTTLLGETRIYARYAGGDNRG